MSTFFRQLITNASQRIEIGAWYSHYKNPNKLYKVILIGIDTKTEEPSVVYTDGAVTWIRSVKEWEDVLDSTPRFTKRRSRMTDIPYYYE